MKRFLLEYRFNWLSMLFFTLALMWWKDGERAWSVVFFILYVVANVCGFEAPKKEEYKP